MAPRPGFCGEAQVMRWRTVAETNSLTTTTAKMAISMTLTACHWNRLIAELSRMPMPPATSYTKYSKLFLRRSNKRLTSFSLK